MPKSICLFGAGPALGQAVARRYADEGYTIVLVARRPDPLGRLAAPLLSDGINVHTIVADLSDTNAVPQLAEQVRDEVKDLDAIYYGPTSSGAIPATALTPQHLQAVMPVTLYTLVALVGEFLPHMIEQREGAILVATGAAAVHGMPYFSGAGPGLAAQRNYLQSLNTELDDKGVYVGGMYIGATIEHSSRHAKLEADKAAGRPIGARGPMVSATHLADLLWVMHQTKQAEAIYPEGLFAR
jgi:short-subunit dehydrogenase